MGSTSIDAMPATSDISRPTTEAGKGGLVARYKRTSIEAGDSLPRARFGRVRKRRESRVFSVGVSCRNPIRVDVSPRNRICVEVPGANVDTKPISKIATSGFAREIQSMSTFRAETSTQIRFATARPAVSPGKATPCRRLLPKPNLCRCFEPKPQHRFDYPDRDLRFCSRNPIYVDVSGRNLGTESICAGATCGFDEQLHPV